MTPATLPLPSCTLVLAHGAGSSAQFLADAFPPERVGVLHCSCLDDRTGSPGTVRGALAAACADVAGPVIVGGVSLGAHAAALLLAGPGVPANVVAGLLVMPAWTGAPDRVADLTATAAEAVAALTPAGVLSELDPDDWVTPRLAQAWALRSTAELVAELKRTATSDAPTLNELRRIRAPVGVVALASDPLHPEAVARRWAEAIPHAGLVTMPRDEPAGDVARFADRARVALLDAGCG